jgi:general secretion pathway protein G
MSGPRRRSSIYLDRVADGRCCNHDSRRHHPSGLGGVNEKAARDRARTEIAAIANALESYRAQRGDYPPARGSSVPYSDIAAYLQISGGAVQGGQLTDPYGSPYVYILPGQRNPASFDLFSQGKDRSDTNKFIGNW